MNEILEKLISDEKRESELLGEKRGEKRGEMRGAKNEKLKIAKTMIKEGLSAELVMKYTGLSKDIVLALQS